MGKARDTAQSTGGVGTGQTWQDVTASRALGVTYTNSTGKPIVVVAHTPFGATGDIYGYAAPYNIEYVAESAGTTNLRLQLIVPNGSQYQISKVLGTGTISKWYELR